MAFAVLFYRQSDGDGGWPERLSALNNVQRGGLAFPERQLGVEDLNVRLRLREACAGSRHDYAQADQSSDASADSFAQRHFFE